MAPLRRVSSVCSDRTSDAPSDESNSNGSSGNETSYRTRSGMLVRNRFDCTECDNKYWDYNRLKKHRKVAHAVKFTCELCRKHFSRKDKLKNHLKTVHMAKRVSCELCGKDYRKKEKLNKHLLAHLGLSFICELCGKVFTRKYRLKAHVRWSHLGIGFRCDTCGNKFCDKIGLQRHMQAVHQTNQFICELCGKAFARIDSLKKHAQSTHLGLFHTCELCGKNFVRKYILKEHVQSVHYGKTYGCELCPKIFSQNCTLKMHIRTVHMGIRHNCELCGRIFQRKNKLKSHICKGFSGKSNLRDINSMQVQNGNLSNQYQYEPSGMVQKKIEVTPEIQNRLSVICKANGNGNVSDIGNGNGNDFRNRRVIENGNCVLNQNEYKDSITYQNDNSKLSSNNSAYVSSEFQREIERTNSALNNKEYFEIGSESNNNINLASDTNIKVYNMSNNLEMRRDIENVNMAPNNNNNSDYENMRRERNNKNFALNNNDRYLNFPNESHSASNHPRTNKTNNFDSNHYRSSQDAVAVANYKIILPRQPAYCSETNNARNWGKPQLPPSENFNAGCDFPKHDQFYTTPLAVPSNIAPQNYNPAWNAANVMSKFPECRNFAPPNNGDVEKYKYSNNRDCGEVFDPRKHNSVIVQAPYANPLMCMFCNVALPDAKSYQYHQRSHFR